MPFFILKLPKDFCQSNEEPCGKTQGYLNVINYSLVIFARYPFKQRRLIRKIRIYYNKPSVVCENKEIRFVCPFCRGELDSTMEYVKCSSCEVSYPCINGIPIFIVEAERRTVKFYEDWHKYPHKMYHLEGIGQPIKSNPFIQRHRYFFEKILYTQFQRERFFKKLLGELKDIVHCVNVLDLGCGSGNVDFLRLGNVYGIDYCVNAMKHGVAANGYKRVACCNAAALPFESEQFDCIVSSDFIGHIPHEEKERLFAEMSRVLKHGGICAHVIETDSGNFVKRFAKKYPDLYRKYFIEGIGGHFGLELPSVVLGRFRQVGLKPVSVRKYYTYLWDIESFIALFDNEYKEKSFLLRSMLFLYKLFCRNFPVKVMFASVLGFLSYLIDRISPLDKAEGIMVICVKENEKNSPSS